MRLARPPALRGLPESASGPAFATAAGLLHWAAGEGRTLHDIDLEVAQPSGLFRRIVNFLAGPSLMRSQIARFLLNTRVHRPESRGGDVRMTLNLTIPQQVHTDFTPAHHRDRRRRRRHQCRRQHDRGNLQGVEFVVANTDAQQLMHSRADRRIQLGPHITQGLGAGAKPEIGKAAAEEAADELYRHLDGAHMVFITAGMGGGTGTGAAPVIARMATERNILTVGVVTKPFDFEGVRRAARADQGIEELQQYVDTLIVIPNQNLFRMANERTTWRMRSRWPTRCCTWACAASPT